MKEKQKVKVLTFQFTKGIQMRSSKLNSKCTSMGTESRITDGEETGNYAIAAVREYRKFNHSCFTNSVRSENIHQKLTPL